MDKKFAYSKVTLAAACFLIALGWPSSAAYSADLTVNATFTEPSKNLGGAPLTDLSHANLYINVKGDGLAAMKSPNISATSANGGGEAQTAFTVSLPENKESTYDVWATATDKSLNESAPTPTITKPYDTLPPEKGTLTITVTIEVQQP